MLGVDAAVGRGWMTADVLGTSAPLQLLISMNTALRSLHNELNIGGGLDNWEIDGGGKMAAVDVLLLMLLTGGCSIGCWCAVGIKFLSTPLLEYCGSARLKGETDTIGLLFCNSFVSGLVSMGSICTS